MMNPLIPVLRLRIQLEGRIIKVRLLFQIIVENQATIIHHITTSSKSQIMYNENNLFEVSTINTYLCTMRFFFEKKICWLYGGRYLVVKKQQHAYSRYIVAFFQRNGEGGVRVGQVLGFSQLIITKRSLDTTKP